MSRLEKVRQEMLERKIKVSEYLKNKKG